MSSNVKGLLVCALLIVGACSGGSKPPPGKPCVVNSDCTDPLSCSYGVCHVTCMEARDCTAPQICVKAPVGNVCQLPNEAKCTYRNQCMPPLACALDRQCRSQCQVDIDCPTSTQKCVQPDGVCAEPGEINHTTGLLNNSLGTPVPDAPPDAGVGDGANGDVATGTGGASGRGGASGAGGQVGTGGVVGACNPQTSFGNLAQGDTNASFTSGVGVGTADQLLIFNAYAGPPPSNFDGGTNDDAGTVDAAAGTGNFIFVQAFDRAAADKMGPPTPLFRAADGETFVVNDVSIAPTGEIVLLHSSNQRADNRNDALYASFFSATTAGAAPKLVRTVLLETVPIASAHAIWAVPSQSFVLSWKTAVNPVAVKIKKYALDGTSPVLVSVPSPPGWSGDPGDEDGNVGVFGSFLGVVFRDGNARPSLTILDGAGSQVGAFVELDTTGGLRFPWMTVASISSGFMCLFHDGSGNTAYESILPVSADGGLTEAPDGGDGGAAPFTQLSFPSMANFGKAINDDTGGNGGVGLVQREPGGASFVYVRADGLSHLATGTVLSSTSSAQPVVTNYHGSFSLSLYDTKAHSTQVIASGCK